MIVRPTSIQIELIAVQLPGEVSCSRTILKKRIFMIASLLLFDHVHKWWSIFLSKLCELADSLLQILIFGLRRKARGRLKPREKV